MGITITEKRVSEDLFKRLKEFFKDDQIIELTATIAFQNMSTKFNTALETEKPVPELQELKDEIQRPPSECLKTLQLTPPLPQRDEEKSAIPFSTMAHIMTPTSSRPDEEEHSLLSTISSLRTIKLQHEKTIRSITEDAEETAEVLRKLMIVVGIKTDDFSDCTGSIFAKRCLDRLMVRISPQTSLLPIQQSPSSPHSSTTPIVSSSLQPEKEFP